MPIPHKISFLQACMMLLLMNGLSSHVIVNPMLLDASGRDAWITVICVAVLFLPWCMLLGFLMKRTEQHKLQPWIAERTHPIVSWLLTVPLILLFYLIGGMTVIHTTTWTLTNYLPETPKIVLITAVTLICLFCVLWGIRILALVSTILLPFVVGLGIFVAVSNVSEKNYHLLQPMLEHGWTPVLNGLIYAGGSLTELIAFVLLQHRISTKVRSWQLIVFGLVSLYIMFGPTIGAITEFGPMEAAKQIESPYEQWRLVRLGPYVEHLDFFSIYQWLSGAVIRIGLSVFLMVELLPIENRFIQKWIVIGVIASYVAASMAPINEYSLYLWMYRIYFPIALTVMVSASILWFAVSFLKQNGKREARA
ncbi:endospore germination permease [Cohnella lubricantis]|uniref:Endospore germination permease n=1 Tax=Cohnella lubricantis TaxID=2163172 RepID=A0A841THH2_9BACL|nr:endospore germination permease [Cohnella lubricantis]MBB6677901.1 endospore germination permease [Cohnella lubricantis]MBP2119084.1 spore germination protein (amino acid permease) [Cohnella lubricantis]